MPTGYVRQPSGEVIFDPDEEVQRVVRLIFRKFEELGTLHGVLAYLVEHGVKLGIRVRQGEAKGELEWRRPNRMTLQNVLRHPIYAGAYATAVAGSIPARRSPAALSTGRTVAPQEKWHVLIKDRLPAYISWERYEEPGAPRRKPGAGGRHGRIPRGTLAASGLVGLRQVLSPRDGPLRWKPQPTHLRV